MPPVDAPVLRAVVDVNVIVRGILSATGGSALILEAIIRKQCVCVSSRQHLNELYRVLARPRMQHRYGITEHRRKRLVARLSICATLVTVSGQLHWCRDPRDDYLIEMALTGRVTHLVTEDADLHDDADIRETLRQLGVRLVHIDGFLFDLARA